MIFFKKAFIFFSIYVIMFMLTGRIKIFIFGGLELDLKKTDIEALLSEGNAVQLKPIGYSMYPMFIPGRDEAIIERPELSKLKRGDVVLYRRDSGKLVLHRIYRIKNGGFYLVGDNQKEVEGPLRGDRIKGVLTGFVRKGKKISANNPIYVLLSEIWLCLRPLRPAISKTVAALKRTFRIKGEKKA